MHGLYLLWWVEERHMPAAAVASILAAGDLALTLIEIPTGWIADRYGHRASLITGSTIQVAGMLACWLGQGLLGLIAASLLVALGDGFRSGASEALLYRSCAALRQERAFQTIEARTGAFERIGLVALILAGGITVETWGFAAGWIAEASLAAVGLALACAMSEPPAALTCDTGTPRAGRRSLSITLALLVFPAAALGAVASAGSFIVQTAGGTTTVRVTAFVAANALSEAAGSWAAMQMAGGALRQQALIAGIGGALVAVAAAAPATFVPVVLALSLLAGVADPLRAAAIQRLAADGARAQAASMASACDMALSTVMLPLAGLWSRR
jgi:MFS family permease